MALKLSKDEKAERGDHNTKLTEAHTVVAEAIKVYNEKRAELWQAVQLAADKFDEAREAAQDWAKDVASRIEDECADKSDNWLESDRGANAMSFQNDYENFEVLSIELEDPGDVDEPDAPASDDWFEGLPEEVE
jgi:hypothetical protein